MVSVEIQPPRTIPRIITVTMSKAEVVEGIILWLNSRNRPIPADVTISSVELSNTGAVIRAQGANGG